VTDPVRVFVVDDHPAVREGLRAFIDTYPELEHAGEAADGEAAVEAVPAARPDVVLMDLELPGIDGVAAIARLRARDPGLAVLVLTSFGSEERVIGALRAGARGYLMKEAGPSELVTAILAVARGEAVLDPKVAQAVISAAAGAPSPLDSLTPREREVLALVAEGLTNAELAERLYISPRTAGVHVSNILAKLGMSSRTEAAAWAVRSGLGVA